MPHRTADFADLTSVELREAALLAPYAMHSADSRGRIHPEPSHSFRGPYQRDRDRIVHSSAFRRLSGKMQVFTGEFGDYHRTRLTHSHEVASIARTLARAVSLNEDLVEALALMHDIGHPPFGHAGEDVLNRCMADCGGFSHNDFALTIVQEIEQRYHDFPGLNLTHEILEGQSTRVDKDDAGRLLEVQVVDFADSATYDAHDTDDAVKLGLVTLDELCETQMIRDALARVRSQYTLSREDFAVRKAIVHELLDRQVTDALTHVAPQLKQAGFESAEGARWSGFRFRGSPELEEQKAELETFLFERVYRHEHLNKLRETFRQRVEGAYHGYVAHPEFLPGKYQIRAEKIGVNRVAGEYIAGMTDRFFNDVYDKHFRS